MAARTKKSTAETAESTVNGDQNVASKQTTTPSNGQNEKQSQLATILVGLLIIASGLLIYNYFQRTNAPETTSQTEQEQSESGNQANNNSDNNASEDDENKSDDEDTDAKEGEYTVVAGDSLWSIAEKVYGNGFDWTKIKDANDLPVQANGQPFVEVGQVLNIPDSAAIAEKPSDDKDVIASVDDSDVAGDHELRETPATAIETYTVQHGDTLWSIAEKVYGDGQKWELIFNDSHNQLGQLSNGSPLVHAGNVLYIPPVL